MASIQGKDWTFSSGWSFHADLRDDAGLVLNKVRHGDYNFASDMRVVKVYVFPGETDAFGVYQTSSYVLGRAECPSTDGQMKLEVPDPRDQGAPAALIRPYSAGQQLSASFKAAPAYKGGEQFTFTQSYLFTDYNKSPEHEPGGIVNAARVYPLFRFNYPANQTDRNPPTRIRVDYRFDIALDSNVVDSNRQSINQVGVFADEDRTPVPPTIQRVFRQAYKPLPVEMYGSGLTSGKSGFAKWDNIHQWPKRDGDLPPTPGAAYAAHSHWRWGAVAAGSMGAPHFAGLGGPGGPLIDPRVPDQSVDFALTGRGTVPSVPVWDVNAIPSTPDWTTLFENGRREPADIQNGATLTQWWSFTAARDPHTASVDRAWAGTFFVHGFFFAHGPEVVPKGVSWPLSLTDPIEKPPLSPRSRKQWLKP